MMDWEIYDGETLVNTIYADEEFCAEYCAAHGYTYRLRPEPPAGPPSPTVEDLQARLLATQKKLDAAIQSNAFLEECIVEMAGVVYA